MSIASQLIPQYNILFDTLKNGQGVFGSVIDALKNDLAIMGVNFSKLPDEIQKAQTELETATGLEKATLERRLAVLQRHQAAVSGVLANDIDPNKTAAAQRAIASNNATGAGDGFIKGLQARIEKADQGEFAMLRLQAAEKGVLDVADPLIVKLKELDIGRAIASYEQALQTQNDELEFQISLIGKSAQEVQLLNAQRKIELELAKQIDQITRSKGSLSPENLQQMQLSADAAVALSESSISKRMELENRWQTGASSAFRRYQDDALNVAKSTEESFTRAFRGMEDAIVSFAMTGQMNFSNLANGIISDIIRIQARAATAGLANMLGSLIGKAVGSMFMPDAGGQHSVQGNSDYVYDLHTSGIAGQGGSGRYLRDMSMFANAPRYHNGGVAGLKPNEVPAVLLKGERVLPPGASVGSPIVNLNVYNESGQQMNAEQNVRKNDSGGFDIDLYIKKVMLNDAGSNGPHTQMIANMFGLRRSA